MDLEKTIEMINSKEAEFKQIVLAEARKWGKERDVRFELETVSHGNVEPYSVKAIENEVEVKATAWWEVNDYRGDVLIEELPAKLCVTGPNASDYLFDKEEIRRLSRHLFEKTNRTEHNEGGR